MAVVECASDFRGIGCRGEGGDISPEIHRIALMQVSDGRKVWMQGNDRSALLREVGGDGSLALQPSRATAWAGGIGDDAGDKGIGEAHHDRVRILEDVASIRGDVVMESDLMSGADGRMHGARVAIRVPRKKPFFVDA